MTMENDLVERLRRAVWRLSGSGMSQVQFWKAYGDKLDGITKTEVQRHEKSRIQALEAELARKTEALRTIAEALQSSIDTHEFNSRHMIAEDSLQDAWKMLDMAREQWAVDANSLREVLTLLPALKDNTNGRAALGPKP